MASERPSPLKSRRTALGGTVNTYAAPASSAASSGVLLIPNVELSSRYAPTTTVSPLTPTDQPKLSPVCVDPTAPGFRYARSLHAPAFRENTNAAPAPVANLLGVLLIPVVELASPVAPTTIVFPLTPTDHPKLLNVWLLPTVDGFT